MIEDDFDIKSKVQEVLDATDFAEQRVAKMDVDDLLKCVHHLPHQGLSLRFDPCARLLSAFHDVGIHFA